MGLEVIGAGFGRTGTLSLKYAVEELLGGPCHHMYEVMHNREQWPLWLEAVEGENPDWDRIYQGYSAAVDWPTAFYFEELVEKYPESKVILTMRDFESWYESMIHTIFYEMTKYWWVKMFTQNAFQKMARKMILVKTFELKHFDIDFARKVYEEHIERVRAVVPKNRLLEFNVAQSWQPLCDFLDVKAPEKPFLRINGLEEFKSKKYFEQLEAPVIQAL